MNKLITAIVLLVIFIVDANANSLIADEEGNIVAETDRYLARFDEEGALSYFHNK